MAAYVVGRIKIRDRDGYANYEAGFMDILTAHHGKLLAVDEAVDVLEGEFDATRGVILEFPDHATATGWYRSDAYQALAQHRFAAATGDVLIMDGLG